jgi:hypothetical protein
MGHDASAHAVVAELTDGPSDAAIARQRLLAVDRHPARDGALQRLDRRGDDARKRASERAHEALKRATVGRRIRLRHIDLPSATVQVLVEEVTSRSSTVIEGGVVEASGDARALAYDRDTIFHSLLWEPIPSALSS